MPIKYKKSFKFLYDENSPLTERIKSSISPVTSLYRTLVLQEEVNYNGKN